MVAPYIFESTDEQAPIEFDLTRHEGVTAVRRGRLLLPDVFAQSGVNKFIDTIFPESIRGGYVGAAYFSSTFPRLYAHSLKIRAPKEGGASAVDSTGFLIYDRYEVEIAYQTPRRDGQDHHAESGPTGDKKGPGGQDGSSQGQTVTFLTHRGSIGIEYFTLPQATLRWQTDLKKKIVLSAQEKNNTAIAVPPDLQCGKIVPHIEHTLVWNYVQWPPWVSIRAGAGKLNDKLWAGAPAETVLFLGADWEHEYTSSKQQSYWKLTYKFSEKNYNALDPNNPRGWNHFWRPLLNAPVGSGGGRYDRLVPRNMSDGDIKRGVGIFDTFNFGNLFREGGN